MRRVLAHLLFCSLETFVRVPRFFLVAWFENTSRSFTRETGDCVADDARRASPIKRAELSAASSSLPTFPLPFFFLPRYLRLPDICTHHAAEARLSPGWRERTQAYLYAAPFVHGRMRGECSSPRDSATRYIHRFDENVFIIRFLSLFSPPLLHSFPLSPLTDSACTSERARSHTNLHENVAKELINLTQENANSAIKLNPIFLSLSRRGFIKRPFRLPPREENSCC